MRPLFPLFALAFGPLAGCAPAAAPCPVTPATGAAASASASAPAPAPAPANPAGDADVALLLRPASSPRPAVHVELALSTTDPAWTAFRLASGTANHVSAAAAHDARGDVPVAVTDTTPGGNDHPRPRAVRPPAAHLRHPHRRRRARRSPGGDGGGGQVPRRRREARGDARRHPRPQGECPAAHRRGAALRDGRGLQLRRRRHAQAPDSRRARCATRASSQGPSVCR